MVKVYDDDEPRYAKKNSQKKWLREQLGVTSEEVEAVFEQVKTDDPWDDNAINIWEAMLIVLAKLVKEHSK